MGQKVHPKGLRLGTLITWDSRWMFSNKKLYRENIISDVIIRTSILKKFKFAVVTKVEIERAINRVTVIIHSAKPGMIIGRGGKGLEEVKYFLSSTIGAEKIKKKKSKLIYELNQLKSPILMLIM